MISGRQPHVLIVEDEWLIAQALQDALEAAGFVVAGTAARVVDALEFIREKSVDAALLDVSLHGEKSFPIARALADKCIPFIFMTGYVSNDFPQDFKGRPLLNKPVDDIVLVKLIHRLLDEARTLHA